MVKVKVKVKVSFRWSGAHFEKEGGRGFGRDLCVCVTFQFKISDFWPSRYLNFQDGRVATAAAGVLSVAFLYRVLYSYTNMFKTPVKFVSRCNEAASRCGEQGHKEEGCI
jgi:hypothetical protein